MGVDEKADYYFKHEAMSKVASQVAGTHSPQKDGSKRVKTEPQQWGSPQIRLDMQQGSLSREESPSIQLLGPDGLPKEPEFLKKPANAFVLFSNEHLKLEKEQAQWIAFEFWRAFL